MDLSLSEKLTYSTIRIECERENNDVVTGTGFFYNFIFDDAIVPVLVTNKHVIENASRALFHFNLSDETGQPLNGKFYQVTCENVKAGCILHPESNVDLCIIPIGPIIHKLSELNQLVFYTGLDKSMIPTPEQLLQLTAIEDVIMIGYPNGIWDSVNNMPIVRKGITATHPRLNYNGKYEFMIDVACFPGSSGSPVLLYNFGTYTTRDNLTVVGTRLMLLGILYAGPQYTAEGKIEIVDVPTQQQLTAYSRIPNNLGIIIKAEKLFDFETILEDILERNSDHVNNN